MNRAKEISLWVCAFFFVGAVSYGAAYETETPPRPDRDTQRAREQCQADCALQDWTYESRWYGDSCTCHGSARKSD